MLELFGLTSTEMDVYRETLRHPEYSHEQTAAACLLETGTVVDAYRRLAERGLVRLTGQDLYLPERPDIAVAARLAQEERELLARQEALVQSRRTVNDLVDTYLAGALLSAPASELQAVQGYPAIRAGLAECSDQVTTVIRTINVGLANPAEFGEQLECDADLLSKGISLLSLMPAMALEEPPNLEHMLRSTAMGEEYRTMVDPPLTLIVYDDTTAVIPVDHGDVSRGALFLRSPSLIHPMTKLFDLCWATADLVVVEPVAGLDERDRVLLSLLANGLNDEAIARQTHRGLRTVRRDIARLMDDLGARSRFEAGVRAARRGWL